MTWGSGGTAPPLISARNRATGSQSKGAVILTQLHIIINLAPQTQQVSSSSSTTDLYSDAQFESWLGQELF
jgi:hypothetical protein